MKQEEPTMPQHPVAEGALLGPPIMDDPPAGSENVPIYKYYIVVPGIGTVLIRLGITRDFSTLIVRSVRGRRFQGDGATVSHVISTCLGRGTEQEHVQSPWRPKA